MDTEGHVIGKVNGENASQFNGSVVDQQGDILDAEGNVIGQANLDEGVVYAQSEVASKAAADKPDLTGPFGVQDNGEVTNATGIPVGKLVEGEPQDLVGTSIKDIDSQGNLLKGSGSIVGKVELDKAAEAAPEDVGSKLEDSEAKLDEAGEKVDEVGEKADEVGEKATDEVVDLSVLEGKKINKAGKVVDEKVSVF